MGSKFALSELFDHMRSSTLKWIVLTATALLALIIVIQLFWLDRIYSFEQKNFNTNVVKSIRGIYEDMQLADSPAIYLEELIENPRPDFFLFRTSPHPEQDSVLFYLRQEFNDFNILTNTHIAFYSTRQNRYVAEYYQPSAAPRYKQEVIELPLYERDYDYIMLYFPHRTRYVLSQMNFWFISSGVLVIVIIGLAISLFYFYRQKFLGEVQKDFVNNFTHEFKTPLAVMKISTNVLLQDKIITQPDRLKKYADILENQTTHLQNQVERLLQFAASDRGELSISKTKVSVAELVEHAIAKVQPLIEEKQAKTDILFREEDLYLYADKEHLELAVVNLLENALKYSSQPYILVVAGQKEHDIFISVKDNGVGIEKEFQKKIFKKFYRVPTGDVHNVKGFGLGLNFVKRIIDAHHGHITINSLPGIGTEFILYLPAPSKTG